MQLGQTLLRLITSFQHPGRHVLCKVQRAGEAGGTPSADGSRLSCTGVDCSCIDVFAFWGGGSRVGNPMRDSWPDDAKLHSTSLSNGACMVVTDQA